jgi:rhamnogalacturonan endolyase
MLRRALLLLGLALCGVAMADPASLGERGRLVFSDDFTQGLDGKTWVAEIAPKPGSSVRVEGGRLVLDTVGGVTVWLNRRLGGDLLIEYRRRVVVQGGPNDRLSDVNQFWMATAPDGGSPLGRDGVFESYDDLSLYYVGIGGNGNTSTRLRKYGGGQRVLLQERLDAGHLLEPNHDYLVQTLVKSGRSAVYVDGRLFFEFRDAKPLKDGWFGLRSTWSRQEIGGVRIYALD